jgi:hypothetical protein
MLRWGVSSCNTVLGWWSLDRKSALTGGHLRPAERTQGTMTLSFDVVGLPGATRQRFVTNIDHFGVVRRSRFIWIGEFCRMRLWGPDGREHENG